MIKIIPLFLGIILCSISLFFTILYLNLFTMGYSFFKFVKFINTRFECLLFYVGIVLIIYSIERKIKNELLLRSKSKF